MPLINHGSDLVEGDFNQGLVAGDALALVSMDTRDGAGHAIEFVELKLGHWQNCPSPSVRLTPLYVARAVPECPARAACANGRARDEGDAGLASHAPGRPLDPPRPASWRGALPGEQARVREAASRLCNTPGEIPPILHGTDWGIVWTFFDGAVVAYSTACANVHID